MRPAQCSHPLAAGGIVLEILEIFWGLCYFSFLKGSSLFERELAGLELRENGKEIFHLRNVYRPMAEAWNFGDGAV